MAQNINNNNDIIASGKITTKTSLSALSDREGKPKPLSSTIHEIGGLSWRMEIRKVVPADGPSKLDLYVYCNENVKDKLWLCNVHFSVDCEFVNAHRPRTQNEYGPLYGFNTYYWVLEDIADELQMQQENDMAPIAIKLEIKIMHIQKSFRPLDATLEIKIDENRTAGIFRINKHALASFSNYFENLFFADGIDKAENHFEIVEANDFDVQAFGFMIYSLMTMGGMINRSNFLLDDDLNDEDDNGVTFPIKMVKLAIKYEMPIMVDYCEKVLMDCKDHSKLDLLELADQHPELNKLKKKCLNGLSIQDLTKNLAKTTPIISRLSENTKQRLDAIMAGKTEEMCNSLVTMNDEIRAKKPRLSLDKMKKVILGNE